MGGEEGSGGEWWEGFHGNSLAGRSPSGAGRECPLTVIAPSFSPSLTTSRPPLPPPPSHPAQVRNWRNQTGLTSASKRNTHRTPSATSLFKKQRTHNAVHMADVPLHTEVWPGALQRTRMHIHWQCCHNEQVS